MLSSDIPEIIDILVRPRCIEFFFQLIEQQGDFTRLCASHFTQIIKALLVHDFALVINTFGKRATVQKLLRHVYSPSIAELLIDIQSIVTAMRGLDGLIEYLRSTKFVQSLVDLLREKVDPFVCFSLTITRLLSAFLLKPLHLTFVK